VAARRDGWKSQKHAAQWLTTLDDYAFPHFGDLSVAAVDVALVHKALEPIWTDKTETASRVRGRIEAVLDWATTRGYRHGENPARWRGHLEHLFPGKTSVRAVQHHPALPYADLPAFWASLATEEGLSAEALRFAILTAARTNEVVPMAWDEVDLEAAVWTVPPERMKGKKNKSREHRVPLSKPTVALLRARRAVTGGLGYVFSAKPKRPLSNMAMLKLLERMGRADITVHGFRSTFRDWVEETTNYAGTVAEAALAHVVGDKVEAAYRRGDLFEKRRKLMDAWGRYCTTQSKSADIVPITGRAVKPRFAN
jgi:integrase